MSQYGKGDNMKRIRFYIGLQDNFKRRYSIEDIKPILNRYYEGYNITKTFGVWHGCQELSCIVETLQESDSLSTIVAEEIKAALNQEGVLVTVDNTDARF